MASKFIVGTTGIVTMALLLGNTAWAGEGQDNKAAAGAGSAQAVAVASAKGDKAYRELKTAMSEFSTELAMFTSDYPQQYRLSLDSDGAH